MKNFFAQGRKNFMSDILPVLALVIALPLSVLVIVFYVPIDYIKYKRSLYCKQTGERYSFFMGSSPSVVFYNIVFKNNLSIRYVPVDKDSEREFGWFVYENTLIIPSCFSFTFDDEKQQWVCESEKQEGEDPVYMTLEDYIELEMTELNKACGDKVCDKAVVLIKKSDVYNADLAKSETRFLLYSKNLEEAICIFCGL
ncbi:MAG: hypothetical protein IKY44_03025 [Clostridia bacterium]|nr:hypothetical protein [Clostridia bacterium]